jgi:large subunit ribosomal protein L29
MSATKKFRDQSIDELKASYLDLSKELFRLKNEFRTSRKLEKPHMIRMIKRERARALTVLQEKGGTIS